MDSAVRGCPGKETTKYGGKASGTKTSNLSNERTPKEDQKLGVEGENTGLGLADRKRP